jgi:hypothetical protein
MRGAAERVAAEQVDLSMVVTLLASGLYRYPWRRDLPTGFKPPTPELLEGVRQ